MNTRQDFIQKRCTYREYYSQFVNEEIRARVARRFSIEGLKQAFVVDPNFTSIPMREWDMLAIRIEPAIKFVSVGEERTQAVMVCIVKEAALQVVEGVK